jgi:hypothetical protein
MARLRRRGSRDRVIVGGLLCEGIREAAEDGEFRLRDV